MKKSLACLAALVFLATIGFGQTPSSRFSLKLSGGVGYFQVGELNKTLEGLTDYFYVAMSNVSGRYENMHLGMNFNAEVVYLITERIGIGVGGGFFRVSKKDKVHYEYSNNTVRVDYTHPRTISSVPLTLNIHYLHPLGSKLNLALSVGMGYYLTSFQYKTEATEARPTITNHETDTYDFGTKGTIGLQASLGLEVAVTRNLGIFVAARGWSAKVSGFLGDQNSEWVWDNEPGTLKESDHRFWVYDNEFDGVKYPNYNIAKEAPQPGEHVSNIHELKIDLSGFSLGLGLRINF
jgi:opacity protein-like surface antigen